MYAIVLLVLVGWCCMTYSRPNIVILMADDLGYHDVSWHNSQVLMPNLHNLAQAGIILDQHYSQATCAPSRGALLTGRYPVNIQMNPRQFKPTTPFGLPTKYPTMAEMLKSEGYVTHAVGKWHLGFCNKKYLPTSRGFDHHFGFWLGSQDYYNHLRGGGYDLRSDLDVVRTNNKTYSAKLYGKKAAKIISSHRKSKDPLFMYLAFQSVHGPLQVPKEYKALYSQVKNETRRTYLGMVTAMDTAVGQVVAALKKNDMANNTVIVFLSDNGGHLSLGADNSPLRGSKGSLLEGGTRTPSFMTGYNLLPRTETRMFHITDWLPTLMDMAGVKYRKKRLDGVSHWASLSTNKTMWNRKEMLYAVRDMTKVAMRVGDWKLILPKQLYNLRHDVMEKENMAKTNQDIVRKIMARMDRYTKDIVKLEYPKMTPKGHPRHWNGTWTYGWC